MKNLKITLPGLDVIREYTLKEDKHPDGFILPKTDNDFLAFETEQSIILIGSDLFKQAIIELS